MRSFLATHLQTPFAVIRRGNFGHYSLGELPVTTLPFRNGLYRVDHTTGLYKSFSAGTIYTSEGTASLVIELIGVNAERVKALPMNKPVMVAGFELTLVDANHCPAAVM